MHIALQMLSWYWKGKSFMKKRMLLRLNKENHPPSQRKGRIISSRNLLVMKGSVTGHFDSRLGQSRTEQIQLIIRRLQIHGRAPTSVPSSLKPVFTTPVKIPLPTYF